jgi:hypothetical protein
VLAGTCLLLIEEQERPLRMGLRPLLARHPAHVRRHRRGPVRHLHDRRPPRGRHDRVPALGDCARARCGRREADPLARRSVRGIPALAGRSPRHLAGASVGVTRPWAHALARPCASPHSGGDVARALSRRPWRHCCRRSPSVTSSVGQCHRGARLRAPRRSSTTAHTASVLTMHSRSRGQPLSAFARDEREEHGARVGALLLTPAVAVINVGRNALSWLVPWRRIGRGNADARMARTHARGDAGRGDEDCYARERRPRQRSEAAARLEQSRCLEDRCARIALRSPRGLPTLP